MKKYGRFNYKVKIEKSWYYEGDKKVQTDIPYLNFDSNGTISIESEDPNGPYVFRGYINDMDVVLIKNYTNTNVHIYYYGKFEKNKLNLVYSFSPEWEFLRSLLSSGDYMACMLFSAQLYELFINGIQYDVFLDKDVDGELKGLGVIEGKLKKISLNTKNGFDAKLRLKYADEEVKKYAVKISGNRIVA